MPVVGRRDLVEAMARWQMEGMWMTLSNQPKQTAKEVGSPVGSSRDAAFFEHVDAMEEALRVALGHFKYVAAGARNERERQGLLNVPQMLHDAIRAVRRA